VFSSVSFCSKENNSPTIREVSLQPLSSGMFLEQNSNLNDDLVLVSSKIAARLVGRSRDRFPVVTLDFSVTYSFRPYHGPGFDLAPGENEYQEHFLGVKSSYYSVHNLLSFSLLSEKLKIKIYRTIIIELCSVWV